MGQNQGKEGEPGQDNSSAGPEEKGPSPDPGGAPEEGNLSIETGGVGADEEKAAGESLDGGPGRESTSPTLEQALGSHDKVCAPTDGGMVEGGDGEKKRGSKSSEEGRAEPLDPQQLNEIRQSDSCTQGTWEARHCKPAHEREDMAKAKAGEAIDLKSKLEDNLEHNKVRQHQENLGCKFECPHEEEKNTSDVRNKMESPNEIENILKCQEEDRGLEADAEDEASNVSMSSIVKASSDNTLTNTGSDELTFETVERLDISKPLDAEVHMEDAVHNSGTSPTADDLANTKVHFLNQDKTKMTSPTESQDERQPAETSKGITKTIQPDKEGIQENPPENPDKDITKTPNSEHSSPENAEAQGHRMKDVCRVQENVTGLQPTDDVMRNRFYSSSLAGADLQNKAESLEQAHRPEDLSPLEVTSKSPLGQTKSHQQKSAGQFTQDEDQKGSQFNVSDLECRGTMEPSLERSPAEGQENKDGIRKAEEIKNLESSSKGLYCSYAKQTEIKDVSLHEIETEEGYCVSPNIASVSKVGKNKHLQQSYEDEKCVTSSEDITDSYPPSKSDIQVSQKNETDFPLSEKAKVHIEKGLESFLPVISPQPEILTLSETVKDIKQEMDPKLTSSVTAVIDVEDAVVEQRLEVDAKFSGSVMSSERDKAGQFNQSVISSKTDMYKETSATSSISELIAGFETVSGHKEDRPKATAPLSSVDMKAEVALPGSPQLQEKLFSKILTNESTPCTVNPTEVSDKVQDGCAVEATSADDETNTSASQHSPSMCDLISMQAYEKRDKEQNTLSTQANLTVQASNTDGKHASRLDQEHATESSKISLTTDSVATVMETPQGAQKSRHVSDMIKETIELHKKMKEWTKPTEARVDLTLDPAQSVKVAQMKAAFDPPKKSPDKALERKTSVRKGLQID